MSNTPQTVAIFSAHNWESTRNDEVADRVAALPKGSTIYIGGLSRVDRVASAAARANGIHVVTFPCDWETHGELAPFARIREMLEASPDLVITFRWTASPYASYAMNCATRNYLKTEYHGAAS